MSEVSTATPPKSRRLSLTGKRYRHPSDVARAVFWAIVLAFIVLLDAVATDALQSITVDLLLLFDGIPEALVDGTVGLIQLLATIAPIVVLWVLLRQRSWSQLVVVAGAVGFAVVVTLFLSGFIDEGVDLSEFGYERVNSWFIGTEYPPAAMLAAIIAVFVALSPQMERRWRTTGWIFIIAMIVARAVTATEVPVRNGMLLAVAALSGSLALVVFGAPRRRVDPAVVTAALAGVGVETSGEPEQLTDRPTYVVQTVDDEELLVKVLGRDQRDADLLISGWRAFTTKGLGDSKALRSPVGAAENETLSLGLFRSAGASVPTPVALTSMGEETAVLAVTQPPGVRLTEAGADVSDAALADLWRQVHLLQERRLAHRRFTAANVVVDGDRVHLVNLGRAAHDQSDEVLGADVADLLVSTALVVGVGRTVDAAATQLASDELARAVPLIQVAALSPPTQEALKEFADDAERDAAAHDEIVQELAEQDLADEAAAHKHAEHEDDEEEEPEEVDAKAFVALVRHATAEHAGIEDVELSSIKRITIQGVVSLVGSLVLLWYVFSLASDWEQIWDAFTRANLIYVIPILLLSLATYLTGAMSLMGAVPIKLGFGRTTTIMFGQSYLNRFTPANAGGMAMRIRYLQLQGLEAPVAVTSIGLTSAASGIAQVGMIVLFLIWGGASDRFSDFETPAIGPIMLIIIGVGLVVWVVLASTWGREKVRPWLSEVMSKIRGMMRDIAADPMKMTQLLGGAVLGKLANIAAFWLSTVAFDVDISFPKAGALYIIATTIGSAVPTPGGVGGVDAALTAALLGFGVPNADAAAIVLLFRILTFWLPTLPGYVAMRYCQRTGLV